MIRTGNITGKGLSLLVIIAYAIIGFLIYSDVILNGIFMFDDFEYVVGNPIIQDLTFFKDMKDPRHIGYLSFALNNAVHGETPFGYIVVNVIIHITNAILVFFFISIILRLLGPEGNNSKDLHAATAVIAGLIFLVHPVETQAVSYITQRFTSLSALFYLLSVFLYLMSRERLEKASVGFAAYTPYVFSVLSAIFAMKTKEISFTIPFILIALEILMFRDSIYYRRRFIFLIPYIVIMIIIPVSLFGPEFGLIDTGTGVDEITRKDKIYDLYERSAYEYLFTQFRVIITYIRLMILPVNQMVEYDLKASVSFFELRVIYSLLLLLLLAGCAFYLWQRAYKASPRQASYYKLASLGIIWFFITLSVESSVIPIKDLIFEHRVYLPSVGFFGALSVLLIQIAKRFRRGGGDLVKAGIITLIIVVPLSAATYVRNEVWTDEIKFWDDVVRKAPDKAIGYNNRGNAYGKKGMYEPALRDLDKTISYFPTDFSDRIVWENADVTPTNMAKTYMNRGNIYNTLGYNDLAKADFDMAKRVMSIR